MTQRSTLPLSDMTQAELLDLLALRLEAATVAESAARAANEAVAEVFKYLHRPMPLFEQEGR